MTQRSITGDEGPDGSRTGPGPGGQGRGGDIAWMLGAIIIGVVVGTWAGMTVFSLVEPDDAPVDLAPVEEEVDALSTEIGYMGANLADTQRQLAASSGELDSALVRLGMLQAIIMDMDGRIGDAGRELDRMDAQASGVQTRIDELRGRIETVQGGIVDLQKQLAELLVALNVTGGGNGNGTGGGPPLNATLLPQPHLTHYRSPLLNFACAICHNIEPVGDTILYSGKLYFNGSLEAQGFNTTIDRDTECVECHGQFPTTGMEPSYKGMTCTACHDDWADVMTATYVNKPSVTADDCLTCHGGANAFIDIVQVYT